MPIHSLPAVFDQQKAALLAVRKTASYLVSGLQVEFNPVIKTKKISFDPSSRLEFRNVNVPFIIIYGDQINFDGKTEIALSHDLDLDGADGANAPATPAQTNKNGNHGYYGFAGHSGKDAPAVPQLFLFARKFLYQNTPATPSELQGRIFCYLDGFNGGRGGTGGRGGDGQNGKQGEPAKSNWTGYWCDMGPGWGGAGGNAGLGGMPGDGGSAGDGGILYMFVDPAQEMLARSLSVSSNRGLPGHRGNYGRNGNYGLGGPEGNTAGTACSPAGRSGRNGIVPSACPLAPYDPPSGQPGPAPSIITYTGWEELGA